MVAISSLLPLLLVIIVLAHKECVQKVQFFILLQISFNKAVEGATTKVVQLVRIYIRFCKKS